MDFDNDHKKIGTTFDMTRIYCVRNNYDFRKKTEKHLSSSKQYSMRETSVIYRKIYGENKLELSPTGEEYQKRLEARFAEIAPERKSSTQEQLNHIIEQVKDNAIEVLPQRVQ